MAGVAYFNYRCKTDPVCVLPPQIGSCRSCSKCFHPRSKPDNHRKRIGLLLQYDCLLFPKRHTVQATVLDHDQLHAASGGTEHCCCRLPACQHRAVCIPRSTRLEAGVHCRYVPLTGPFAEHFVLLCTNQSWWYCHDLDVPSAVASWQRHPHFLPYVSHRVAMRQMWAPLVTEQG
jgi:hypothetical protein